MKLDQRTIVITGSGRSGTYNIHNFLKSFSNYSVHHEFCFNEMLKFGVLSYEGESSEKLNKALIDPYLREMCQKNLVSVDVSNAAIWCINELFKRCEGIEIHMVVRNGYKVVASFYNKFQELMYPENNISLALSAFRNKNFDHPLDKTFWRPLPQNPGFYEKYDGHLRFAVICWYWTETIKRFEENIELFSGFYRFEDLVSGKELKRFTDGFGIRYSEASMKNFFKRPSNIENRINYKLSKEQKRIFDEICGAYMNKYYADLDYYDVKY